MTRFTQFCVLLLVLGPAVLLAQSLSLGMTGGARASGDFDAAPWPGWAGESRRYVVGPAAAFTLPLGFAVEFEALYRRQGYSVGWGSPLYTSSIREADNVWEFPLLVRYRIPLRRIHPFAEGGWAPRITYGSEDVSGCYLSSPTAYQCYSGRSHTDWPLTHGVIAGGGIQITAGRLQFAPQVRYTHWNRQNISGGFPDGPSYGSTQNQLDVLLGISLRLAGRAAK